MLDEIIQKTKYFLVGSALIAGCGGTSFEVKDTDCCSVLQCTARGYDDCRYTGEKIINKNTFQQCECIYTGEMPPFKTTRGHW
jgi:hypothetical protein